MVVLMLSAGGFHGNVTAKINVSKCLSLLFGKLNSCIFLSFIMSRLLHPRVLPLLKVILRETQK